MLEYNFLFQFNMQRQLQVSHLISLKIINTVSHSKHCCDFFWVSWPIQHNIILVWDCICLIDRLCSGNLFEKSFFFSFSKILFDDIKSKEIHTSEKDKDLPRWYKITRAFMGHQLVTTYTIFSDIDITEWMWIKTQIKTIMVNYWKSS